MTRLVEEIERSYAELNEQLTDPEVLGDRARYAAAARRHSALQAVYELALQYREAERAAAGAEALLAADDEEEFRELAQQELAESRARLDELGEEIRGLVLTADPYDAKDVIIEIRAGTGGDEAGLFAGDLARMYTRYAQAKGFEVEILSANEGEAGGFKEVILEVRGQGAYSALKYESGVHRVQRVPSTESVGRIHTSTATVAVLPEAEEIDVELHANDLRIDIFRARGPGGQSVNTTDSAVRITHLPTGVTVSCQDEKSQLQNKERALRILRARLFELERERQEQERGDARRGMVGSGARSQKIRTYNFSQNRVSDHRIGLTSHRLGAVLEGELDEFTEALAAEDRRAQLAAEVGEE
ncbi:MAG: peptide chain release factor 1 [Thermoleophilia bacterium]|nr:peptide chain release factor 1 [Thermoleophilia bacterium]